MKASSDDSNNPHVSSASGVPYQQSNRGREALPGLQFPFQLLPAIASQRIHLRAAPQIRLLPRRADPALILQPVQPRVQRSLPDRQSVAREHLYPFGDPPAVQGLTRDGFQNQQIERSLQQIRWFGHVFVTSTIDNIPRLSTIGKEW